LSIYQVFSRSKHAKQSVMILQDMYLQEVCGRKGSLTVLTAVTMQTVIMSFIAEEAGKPFFAIGNITLEFILFNEIFNLFTVIQLFPFDVTDEFSFLKKGSTC